jgi:hypothetical protein
MYIYVAQSVDISRVSIFSFGILKFVSLFKDRVQ